MDEKELLRRMKENREAAYKAQGRAAASTLGANTYMLEAVEAGRIADDVSLWKSMVKHAQASVSHYKEEGYLTEEEEGRFIELGYQEAKDQYERDYNGYRESYAIGAAMKRFGGNFFEALGVALQRADSNNERKIRQSWPEEWARYREMTRYMPEFGGQDNDQ